MNCFELYWIERDGKKYGRSCEEHPYAIIQEQWTAFLSNGSFTYQKYLGFLAWKKGYLSTKKDNI